MDDITSLGSKSGVAMLGLENPIYEIPFSNKERRALDLLGVSTVGDFMRVDLRQVLDLSGFGACTYAKLEKIRKRAQSDVFPDHGAVDSTRQREKDHDSLRALGLSARGIKALRRLKLKTVDEFLASNLKGLLPQLRNCGVVTQEHLRKVQAELRRRAGLEIKEEQSAVGFKAEVVGFRSDQAAREFMRQPVAPLSWMRLPLFSGLSISEVGPGDLHQSYQPYLPIERLVMTAGVRETIAGARIASFGQLLLTPGTRLVEVGRDSARILTRIRSMVDAFLNRAVNPLPPEEVDVRTPDGFLFSLLKPVLSNERQRYILLERMGWRSKPRRLEDLAQELGVTRERVRQIEKAALGALLQWQFTDTLKPLFDLIRGMLKDVSPLMSLRGISKALQRRFGWERPFSEEAVVKLLPFFPDARLLEGRYLCSRDFRCADCPSLPQLLESILSTDSVKNIKLSLLARSLRAEISRTEACKQCGLRSRRTWMNLVRRMIERSSAAKGRYRVIKNELWNVQHWRLVKGPLTATVEAILKDHGGPMSEVEIHSAASRLRGDEFTPEMVYNAITAKTAHGTEIMLWEHGKIYRHASHVDLHAPVLSAIEKWVIKVLRKGPSRQMSAHAAFQEFHGECLAAGLPSEYAVHSCLKLRNNPKLAFFHSPYLGLAEASKGRISNLEFVNQLIRQEGGVMDYNALKQTVCDRMGLKAVQFSHLVARLDSVIRTENGFLHVDYFDAGSAAISALVKYAKRRLARDGYLSAKLLYAEKEIACRQLRIDGPRMLHAVLLRYGGKAFARSSYPVLAARPSGNAEGNITIIDQVLAFLRDKRQPVSREELHRRFVVELGFDRDTIASATYVDSVLCYSHGVIVHKEALGWNAEKMARLVSVAEQYYLDQQRADEAFARTDRLLELHGNDLPPLAGGLAWTVPLIGDLLRKEQGVRVFGIRRNAYVFHAGKEPLARFGDFVALVLRTYFHGTATWNELSAFLRDRNVIAGKVKSAMLAGASRLVLDARRIVVRERP